MASASDVKPGPATRGATSSTNWIAPAKVAVFLGGLYPLARIVLLGVTGGLGANPIEFITRSTGLWTLVFLCITLTVTPARRLSGWQAALAFRRGARPVRVLLRSAAFHDVYLVRSMVRPVIGRAGRRQAAVYHRGLRGLRADD